MTTYHIDPDGHTANDGLTEQTPWPIGHLASQFEGEKFQPGDQILFRRGRVHQIVRADQWVRVLGCSGTPEAPITFATYGTDDRRPILELAVATELPILGRYRGDPRADHYELRDLEIRNGYDASMIDLPGVVGWTLRHLHVHGNIAYVTHPAIAIHVWDNSSDILIEDCIVEDNEGEAIYCGGAGTVDRTGPVIIRRCILRNNENEGIDWKGGVHDSLAEDCTIENNGHGGGPDWSQFNLGGFDNHVLRCTISGTATPGHRYGMDFMYTHGCNAARRNLIEECAFIETGAETYGALRLAGDQNTILRCTFTDCPTGILATSNECTGKADQVVTDCAFKRCLHPVRFQLPTTERPLSLFRFDSNTYHGGPKRIWTVDGQELSLEEVQALGHELAGTAPIPPTAYRRITARADHIVIETADDAITLTTADLAAITDDDQALRAIEDNARCQFDDLFMHVNRDGTIAVATGHPPQVWPEDYGN